MNLGGPLKPRVTLGIPAYGQQDTKVGWALADLQTELVRRGVPFFRVGYEGCPYFGHVMNFIIASFLTIPEKEGYRDRLLFLDNDIYFRPEDAIRLIESNAECIGADYAKRKFPLERTAARNGFAYEGNVGVDRMGTGFVCLARPLLERMTARAKRYMWNGLVIGELFSDCVEDGKFFGADEMFYRRMREDPTTEPVIDPTIRVGHVGTHTFELP